MRIRDWSSDVCSSDLCKRGSKTQISAHDRLAFGGAISVELDARKLVGSDGGQATQDQDRTEKGENRGAQRIEGLGKRQPAVRRPGRPGQAIRTRRWAIASARFGMSARSR